MLQLMHFGRRGFTLIEIMITVAIIAILAGIVVPNFVQARAEAQLEACYQNCETIGKALEMAIIHSEKDLLREVGFSGSRMPSYSSTTLVNDYLIPYGFLEHTPICPVYPKKGYMIEYRSQLGGIPANPSVSIPYNWLVACYPGPAKHYLLERNLAIRPKYILGQGRV